jgi:hypothetical protein
VRGIPKKNSQTSYVFVGIAVIATAGMVLLIAQSFGQDSLRAGWRYLFIGGMAAIGGLGVGGLVGLIFGLPESAPVVVAAAATTTTGVSASPPTLSPPPATGDWYRDSSSLERIATWLTGAIIALSLANFNSWTTRFEHAATSIGLAMQGSTPADLTAASSRAAAASSALAAIVKAQGESADAYQQRRHAAMDALNLAEAQAMRATSEAEVPGGLLLGGYAILGFLASYLWTRRYLPAELARSRRDMRQETRLDAIDSSELADARANNLTQETSKSPADAKAAVAAVEAATLEQSAAVGPGLVETPAFIQPGPVQNDPWKGQFGGLSSKDHAELSATVREVTGRPGTFLVSLLICGRSKIGRDLLAGTEVRLYLHPTFPEPIIRSLTFDREGVIEVKMSAVGAFTVGVQLLSNGDLLELDLSGLRDAPAAFRLN